ncbi:MAG: Tat pathway signal sequence domain protein [Alphaproteobacteria bacterium]
MSFPTIRVLAAAACFALAASPAVAAGVAVELNRLEPQGDDCRAYLVFENATKDAFSSLKLDLVLFDSDGVIARRLAVEGGPLAAGKTVVRLFDIAKLPCPRIGRVLLNDVLACSGPDGAGADCLAQIEPRSRAAAAFIK